MPMALFRESTGVINHSRTILALHGEIDSISENPDHLSNPSATWYTTSTTAMEQLIKANKADALKIQKVITNYKKDPSERKTRDYLETRLVKISKLWESFDKRNDDIEQFRETNPEQPYFKEDFYDTVEALYEDTRNILEKHLTDLISRTKSTEVVQVQLKEISKQYAIVATLEKAVGSIEKEIEAPVSSAYCTQKMKLINDYWERIIINHAEIMSMGKIKHEYIDNDIFTATETRYQAIIIRLQELLDRNELQNTREKSNSDNNESVKNNKVKLPQVDIPAFNGDYLKWQSFKNLFTELIYKEKNLSGSQKLFYLRSNLTNEASELIQHLQINNENFETAWAILERRYDNKRTLLTAQLNILLKQPSLLQESSEGLKKLHDVTTECLEGIKNLGIETKNWDPLIIHILIAKLDKETHRIYEQSLTAPREIQELSHFLEFLENRFRGLEAIEPSRTRQPKGSLKHPKIYLGMISRHCIICGENHKIYHCEKFSKLNVQQRLKAAKRANLCQNRLVLGHNSSQCKSHYSCKNCFKRHHTLLHFQNIPPETPQQSNVNTKKEINHANISPNGTVAAHFAKKSKGYEVLLATALVRAITKSGDTVLLRALLDQGSQATFITEDAAQSLRLPRRKIQASVSGLGCSNPGTTKSSIEVTLIPRFQSQFSVTTTALVLKNLTRNLPAKKIIPNWKHTENLILADPTFNMPGKIDIILGAEVFGKLILGNILHGGEETPLAQETELGWILSGGISNANSEDTILCMISEIDINTELQRFWECEELSCETITTPEDIACESYYQQTLRRDENGRYIVRIPFKQDPKEVNVSGSRELALARLFQMERKFNTNKVFETMYKDFMAEYQRLGHMVPVNDNDEKHYYIPHHAVLKQDSTTTKLRVVFDASAKRNNTTCLNDIMLKGPQLQQNLISILLRWRKHKVVFTADIEKMYRQIKVDVRDQQYQCILWRESPERPIKEYKLTTVTYGTTSAPFLAIRTLQQLAKDEAKSYPKASTIILNDTYVDDVVSGGASVDEARESCKQLMNMLKQGGFQLRKWTSNKFKVIKDIPYEFREQPSSIDFQHEHTTKALGVHWNPITDTFKIHVSINMDDHPTTKRDVASEAAKIFDPVGLLSPVVMTIKILLQNIWLESSSWDEPLSKALLSQWLQIKSELPKLGEIEIPRWIGFTGKDTSYELHGFSDASEKGYSAALYLRIVRKTLVHTTLITAKTKVAPLKAKLSIPRLELCGATLLANLMKETKKSLYIANLQCYAWTDSTIVLSWLQEDAHKWQTFVGNRVAQIHGILDRKYWYYVKSCENPADIASRGIFPSLLKDHILWWEGPLWLKDKIIHYPPIHGKPIDLEKKVITVHSSTKIECEKPEQTEKNVYEDLLQRYSSLGKLQRTIAYINRFIQNCKLRKENRLIGYLTVKEIEDAIIPIIKITQQQFFSEEISQCLLKQELNKKSRLIPLSPFTDSKGILRVGGRLDQAELPYDRKHPIIIPYKSALTTLVLDKMHKSTLHGGNTLTLEAVRQRFWILNGLKAVKGFIHQCVQCHRNKAQMTQQMMGNLPTARVVMTQPFNHCGVDYAGPFDLLLAKGRGSKSHKGYISVFICLSTKAIHLEVVTELTSQAFIAAFKRLVARRGPVAHMYSDNATNFVGASKILSDLHNHQTHKNDVYNALLELGTQWHFIPPASPHFGGLWEAGVKAIKHHMRRVIGDTKLTYEEMCTLMTQIEACLNSRPLCPLTDNPESLEVLTPGHFLTGSPLLTVPERNHLEDNPNILDKWQRVGRMHQEFWKKWSSEYLSRLQQRPKWTQRQPNLKVGNLVLIKDEQLPPTKWALGRVIETHPGSDGLTRVVTLQTKGSKIKRPVTKISLLPIIDNHMSESADPERIVDAANETVRDVELRKSAEDEMRTNVKRTCSEPVQEPINPKRRRQQRTVPNVNNGSWLSFMTLALLTLVVTGLQVDKPYSITRFNQQDGIYFEDISEIQLYSSEWNLIVYYDLSSYWKEFIGIRKSIQKLSEICQKPGQLTIPQELCNAMILQLQHQFSESTHINEVLYQQNENLKFRMKRAPLEIIGSIANGLFGILDQDFADRYEEQIKSIKENEDLLKNLLMNQTSIAEHTINVIRKNSETVHHQLEIFENHMETIVSGINKAEEDIKSTQAFTSAVVSVMLNLLNFQHMQKGLLSVVTDTKHGRLNTLLLTPKQLREQLRIIKEHLPPNLRVPGNGSSTSLLSIYNSMHVKMRITMKNVLFDIRIPLLSTETYHLYKLIPIPVQQNGTFIYIEPSTQYLAVNLHKDRFTPLTRDDLKDCMHLNNNQLICNLKHPIYSLQSNQSRCELELLNHQKKLSPFCQLRSSPATKKWYKLHTPSTWIFTMDEDSQFDIVCKSATYSVVLNGSGIIQVQPNCMIKHPTLFISSNNQQPSTLNASFITQNEVISNHISDFFRREKSNKSIPLLITEIKTNDLDKLHLAIKEQQHQINKLPNLNKHDLHHYVGVYSLMAIIIILGSYYLWRKRRRNMIINLPQPAPRRPRPQEQTSVMLEVPVLNNPRRENV